MNPRLGVYWEKKRVGWLYLNEHRQLCFQYAPDWLKEKNAVPISLSLPLRDGPYSEDQARPYFTNLLPEARIKQAITQKLGISEGNDFSLLEAIGGECAGAISILPEEKEPSENGIYTPITQDELENMTLHSLESPMILGPRKQHEIRLSLAGAQSKIPLYIDNGKLFLPKGAFSSSHILKPPMPGFKGSVENEAFCMTIAEKINLGVPKIFILPGKIPFYVVSRFDREPLHETTKQKQALTLKRLHQEDFCQAMSVLPEMKYESEGGPGLSQCFQLITQYSSQPLLDQLRLLRWVVFNQLIGNADAHAKNLSILYHNNNVELAPFYDLMCTRIYPKLTSNAAMTIGGEKRLDWIWHRHWEKLGQDCNIKLKLIIETVNEVVHQIQTETPKVEIIFKENKWYNPILKQVSEMIQHRCMKTLKRLDL